MHTMKAPPVLKSTSASGTLQPSGLNQRLIWSARLHALKTSSRGAGNARETIKGSGFRPEDSRGFAIFASFFGDLFEIDAEPIEPALPLRRRALIHCSASLSAPASIRQVRTRPTFALTTRPERSSTARWWVTAGGGNAAGLP